MQRPLVSIRKGHALGVLLFYDYIYISIIYPLTHCQLCQENIFLNLRLSPVHLYRALPHIFSILTLSHFEGVFKCYLVSKGAIW